MNIIKTIADLFATQYDHATELFHQADSTPTQVREAFAKADGIASVLTEVFSYNRESLEHTRDAIAEKYDRLYNPESYTPEAEALRG